MAIESRGRQAPQGQVRVGSAAPGEGSGGHVHLDGFLAATRMEILDVTRGATTGTRRLLLGEPGAGSVSYAVAVADHPGSAPAIDTEIRMLEELRAKTSPPVRTSLPVVVAPVTVDDRPAVVMTALPGHGAEFPRGRGRPLGRADLEAVVSWLSALWRSTGRLPEPVELGRDAADHLIARYCGSRQLAPCLGAVHRARRRLVQHRVARTAVHGCLCPYHMYVRDGVVIGVDDWSLASPSGEPLRDLGGFAVRMAGARLPEVMADQTAPAHLLRDFVMAGLVAAGLPGGRWRDVLLLVQLEKAVDALKRGRVDEIELLAATVSALPYEAGQQETAHA